jgi:hypothetical protein
LSTRAGGYHQWLTLAANLGVLVGIILLVFELNQNRTMIRAQTRSELSTGIVDLFTAVAENPELASLRRRADAGEELGPDELYRYEIITRAFFRYWENVHYQYRQGLYDDSEFSRQKDAWRDYVRSSPALAGWWCAHRTEFSPEFASEFDVLLPTGAC